MLPKVPQPLSNRWFRPLIQWILFTGGIGFGLWYMNNQLPLVTSIGEGVEVAMVWLGGFLGYVTFVYPKVYVTASPTRTGPHVGHDTFGVNCNAQVISGNITVEPEFRIYRPFGWNSGHIISGDQNANPKRFVTVHSPKSIGGIWMWEHLTDPDSFLLPCMRWWPWMASRLIRVGVADTEGHVYSRRVSYPISNQILALHYLDKNGPQITKVGHPRTNVLETTKYRR